MKRLVAPDSAVVESSVQGARSGAEVVYRRQKDGAIHVNNDSHIKAFKSMGYREAHAISGVRASGWVCNICGFHGFFKKCGRCGGTDTVKGDN